jgi:Zn-dependent protease with chaperone function/uncharacterized tellurite resistance protein B-like protein
MDFFTAQDQARRNTGRLVFFFILAVLSLIAMANLLVMAVFGFLDPVQPQSGIPAPIDWQLFWLISLGVILVVAAGSFYKTAALSEGGAKVAEMLGGELLVPGSGDYNRRKILNVVEEMAIASGIPVPPVYLLDEEGINAFAAGFSPSDAVIGVTRGAIEKLSRDQLQGVIAHEFSHILNGDMRLNLRLVGILYGILLLGLIGYQILRGSAYSRGSRKGGGGALALGLGLIVIGYAGTFFGKLIKSAVSRQREYLADAAAVQFTRNPGGIGGALIGIGASETGSALKNPHGAEISHALFSQGVTVYLAGLFATHPPLEQRIRRILPDWDGKYVLAPRARMVEEQGETPPSDSAVRMRTTAIPAGLATGEAVAGLTGGGLLAHVGNPTSAHLEQARRLLRNIADSLQKRARDPFAARALIFYLVLDRKVEIRNHQLQHLKAAADRGVYAETLKLLKEEAAIATEQRLPLVELALPTLRRMSAEQGRRFLENLEVLIKTDGRISLFEWCLQQIVSHHLASAFGKPAGPGHPISDLGQVAGDCVVLLSTLVHAARNQGVGKEEVFALARLELGVEEIELAPPERLNLFELDRSLKVLSRLKPQVKARVIRAGAACVSADGRIEPVEAELLRAIAAALDVPMPPLVIDKSGRDL